MNEDLYNFEKSHIAYAAPTMSWSKTVRWKTVSRKAYNRVVQRAVLDPSTPTQRNEKDLSYSQWLLLGQKNTSFWFLKNFIYAFLVLSNLL